MATAKDIDLTDDLELRIEDGDFKVSESDQNHILLIVKTYLGAFKQYPLVGVGVDYFLSSSGQQQVLRRNITVQLKADSFTSVEIDANDNTYAINAKRILEVD